MNLIQAKFRPKHLLSFSLFLTLLTLIAINVTAAINAAPAASNLAPLQSIPVFKDQAHGQYVGYGDGDYIESPNYSLPIDYSQMNNSLPSYKLNVTGGNDGGGWWLAILAGASWESYSIDPYIANGSLEFNIKSDSVSENTPDFQIAVSDVVFERNPKYCEPVKLSLSNYVTVSTSWQHVTIPLADLVGDGSCSNQDTGSSYPTGTFDPTQVYSIVINGGGGGNFVAYLNDVEWTSPDSEPVLAPIKVNQLGYTPNSPKYALVSGFSDVMLANDGDAFNIRRTGDNVSVHQGTLSLVTNFDAASGEKVLKADFSALNAAGSYVVDVDGVGISAEFIIAETAFDSLIVDSMRYYYNQRQGIALPATHAGIYARGLGHPQDQYVPRESDPTNPNDAADPNNPNNPYARDVMKGWYDAGDYGKYVNAGATAVSDLLWAYELFPNEFPDNHINIPEGGNLVPDILDEVRWELEWILKMQETDGGFYHMVKAKGGDGRSQWDSDTTPDVSPDQRFLRDNDVAGYGSRTNVKPTSVTGDAVAALAHAAVVFEPFDATFANTLEQAAIAGWGYLQANPGYISPIKGAPYTIPYVDFEDPNGPIAPDVDDRIWAAAALYRATGDTQYRSYFDNNYQDLTTTFNVTFENAYGPGIVSIPAVLTYFAADNQTPSVMTNLTNDFYTWRDHMLNRAGNSVWQHTLLDEDYYWGSNYPSLTTPLALAVGTAYLGVYDADIVNLSRQSLNYTLGVNPLQFSYVTGYGENALERPFSQIYNFDNKPGVPAGMLAGGANEYNNAFLYSEFPAKNYQDNAAAWSTNEHTVYWNAVLVFHAALAAHEAGNGSAPTPTPTPIVDPNPTLAPTATGTPLPPTIAPTVQPPTATPTSQPSEPTVNLPTGETSTAGNLTNDYLWTHVRDYALEVVCEQQSGGSASSSYHFVEHIWEFDVLENATHTFVGYIWKGTGGADDMILSYSDDNISYTAIPTTTLGTAWHTSMSVDLPATSGDKLYIRLTDSNRVQDGTESVSDCVFADLLYIESVPVVTTPTPTEVPPTATSVPPTATPTEVPPTATSVPPTATPTEVPPTATSVPPTATPTEVPPTATSVPPTATPTEVPPTATSVPPTATPTEVPPTATSVPPTATAVPPTPTPEPSGINLIYASSSSGGAAGGVIFSDEDILVYDRDTAQWAKLFDGSDVGMGWSGAKDMDAFNLMDDGSILLSIVGAATLPDVGAIDDSDIVRFVPSSLGVNTAGTFEMYFDGSDVELTTNGEDIDSIALLDNGDLILSTSGGHRMSGISGKDEDLLRFTPTQLGDFTSGTWTTYFDGSDVSLASNSGEDVWGVWVDETSGDIYLTTRTTFAVSGLAGQGADVFVCQPSSLGSTTACAFTGYQVGADSGYGGELMDGLHIELPPSQSRAANVIVPLTTSAVSDVSVQPRSSASTPAELMSPDSVIVTPTETVAYPVYFTDTGNAIGLLTFELEYEPAVLSLNSADSDNNDVVDGVSLNLPDGFVANVVVTSEDTANLLTVEISAENDATTIPSGQLATINFTVSADAPQDTQIVIPFVDGTVEMLDGDDLPLEISEDAGSLYINPQVPSAVLLSTSSVTFLDTTVALWATLLAAATVLFYSRRYLI